MNAKEIKQLLSNLPKAEPMTPAELTYFEGLIDDLINAMKADKM